MEFKTRATVPLLPPTPKCFFPFQATLLFLVFIALLLLWKINQGRIWRDVDASVAVGVRHGGIRLESGAGPGPIPPVNQQKIQTCVDLQFTCMGAWILEQISEGNTWQPIIDPPIPPGPTNDEDASFPFPNTHSMPPVCSDLGDFADRDIECVNWQEVYHAAESIGEGSSATLREIKLKLEVLRGHDTETPRFWNPWFKIGVLKDFKGTSRDSISLTYREAIISQSIRQRIARNAPTMIDNFAYAVDVYGHDNSQRQMAMQPRAGSNFDFQSKHGLFRGNVARVKYFAKKMLQIVDVLHKVGGFMHLDLKPHNFLASSDSSTGVILTDWGCALPLQSDDSVHFDTIISGGTTLYSPPEIIQVLSENAGGTRITTTADSFSLGATIFFLYFGHLHFPALPGIHATILYLTQDYAGPEYRAEDPFCDASCHDFFERILHRDPIQRMTISQALQHPWIISQAFPPRLWDDYAAAGIMEPDMQPIGPPESDEETSLPHDH